MLRPKLENLNTSIGNCLLQRNESGAELILSNKKSFSITAPESCILETLIKNDKLISTKEELVISAWGSPDIIGSNSLPVAITNLRKVLKLDNIKIINIQRKGYKLNIPESEASLDLPKQLKLNHYPKYAFLSIYSTILITIIIGGYFSFWHEFEIVNVNVNNQSSQICLTKKDELELILTSSEKQVAFTAASQTVP
ncbi:transcriptional regulator [Vibrio sp. 10N.222.54.A1]